MEENFSNHLDDILLEKEQNKFEKIKKIILLVASLALVFTISIIVMKVLNSKTEDGNMTNILPSEPIAEQDIKEPEPLFEQLPLAEEEAKVDSQFDQIVKGIELKAKEDMITEAEKEIEKELEKPQNSAEALASNNLTPPKEEKIGFEKLPQELREEKPKKVEPKEVKKESVKVEAVEVSKTTPIVQTIEESENEVPKGWYIQVGAFKSVQKVYTDNIVNSGFEYQLRTKTKSDGSSFTKVLIGPYNNKTEAKEALEKVKEKIAKGAYLTKV